MKIALERTYAATPDPKWVVAVRDCGCGVIEGSYGVIGAVDKVIPVTSTFAAVRRARSTCCAG